MMPKAAPVATLQSDGLNILAGSITRGRQELQFSTSGTITFALANPGQTEPLEQNSARRRLRSHRLVGYS
jgi:hypothetical protein